MLDRVPMKPGLRVVVALALAGNLGCGIIGPSCNDETGAVLTANEEVRAGAERFFDVVSPKDSNLVMRLTWTDPNAELALRATITNCGGHVGCSMDTARPSSGSKGVLEMEVDGWRGKTWRIAVTGDAARDANFTLGVSYKITCER